MQAFFEKMLNEQLETGDFTVWISRDWNEWTLVYQAGSALAQPPVLTAGLPLRAPQARLEADGFMSFYLPYSSNVCIVVRVAGERHVSTDAMNALVSLLYPYYSDFMAARHEQALNTMMNSFRDVTQLLDLDELLERILASALDVIPYDSIGVLWSYDPAIGALKVKARAGEMGKDMLKMRMKPGEGIIGKTFVRGEPRLYNSMQMLEEDVGNMSKENQGYLHNAYHFENICSIFSVPIKVAGQTECVLIFYQKGKIPLYGEAEVRLLQSFADQVSIAITNAKLYAHLSEQNETLVRRDEIHSALMKLSLQNKGVSSIVGEMGRILGLPLAFVDFIDRQWHPKRVDWIRDWSMERLLKLYHSLQPPEYFTSVEGEGSEGQLHLYPIASARQCLGYLLVQAEGRLTPLQWVALEQGSSILALELMRKQSLAELYFKKTQQLFNDLRLSKNSAEYWERSGEFGIGPASRIAVGLLEWIDPGDPAALGALSLQLISFLKDHAGQQAVPLAFASERRVTLLLIAPEGSKPGELERKFTGGLADWERKAGMAVFGGLGSVRTGIDAVNTSYQEADKALAYQKSRGRPGTLRYADIGVNRLFIRQPAEDLAAFIAEIFEPLRPAKGAAAVLEDTLTAYMASGGSAAQTAAALHIHINTLYQRIHKIEELLGMSFSNQEHLLHLQLACYLRQTHPGGKT
ncbi:helix-turn-helix domain-containing protein [Paenibacillus sp. NFR01]|uniref:helix-turn-helix domain-containing protein n=1 Tax=Paenibacillus sp. NFR01 TaxID=1566279 RepID=UPI0008D786C4|nr:helix-turn-helix domain-containing protein [Paenibacillus sp. NFR01]SEU28181.1 GAF domain-containing protein [Paenibacillus sp. NFR01]